MINMEKENIDLLKIYKKSYKFFLKKNLIIKKV